MKRSPLQRSRKPMKRTELERRTRLRPRKRYSRMVDVSVWREGLGPCVVCGSTVEIDGHHVIPARVLRRLGLAAFLSDTRNRASVCRFDHERHESRTRPLHRDELPASVFEFADELGLGWYLDRHYAQTAVAA